MNDMDEKYAKFRRLKQSIINRLSSIVDGTGMDSYSDTMVEDIKNSDTFKAAMEEMKEAEELVNELVEHEKEYEM